MGLANLKDLVESAAYKWYKDNGNMNGQGWWSKHSYDDIDGYDYDEDRGGKWRLVKRRYAVSGV